MLQSNDEKLSASVPALLPFAAADSAAFSPRDDLALAFSFTFEAFRFLGRSVARVPGLSATAIYRAMVSLNKKTAALGASRSRLLILRLSTGLPMSEISQFSVEDHCPAVLLLCEFKEIPVRFLEKISNEKSIAHAAGPDEHS